MITRSPAFLCLLAICLSCQPSTRQVGSICSCPFLILLLTIGAGNYPQGPQRGLLDAKLLRFLRKRREIARLSAIIGGGFYCEESNAWTRFLVRGLYDPRLLIFIFDFAFDLSILESGRKNARLEEAD